MPKSQRDKDGQPSHEQIRVRVDGDLVKIDRAIAPLVRVLNKFRIKTLESCQGDSEHGAWVCFISSSGASNWIDLAGTVFADLAPYLSRTVGDSASLSVRMQPSGIFLGEISIRPGRIDAVTKAIQDGLLIGETG